jgi:hypothetical protein
MVPSKAAESFFLCDPVANVVEDEEVGRGDGEER